MLTDLQDPLPENKWTWRRLFAWFTNLATLGGVGWIIWQLGDDPGLVQLAYGLLVLNALNSFTYMTGPSAVEWKALAEIGATRRAGIVERAAEMVQNRMSQDEAP